MSNIWAEAVKLIKQEAVALGFDACGVADTEPFEEPATHLKTWLEKGMNGTMQYMATHLAERISPRCLMPEAQSCIVVLMNYKPAQLQPSDAPQVAKYAYGNDYHYIIRQKLVRLLDRINTTVAPCKGIACCDTAPVLERALAVRAGLGWIGKNGLLIHPVTGSYCLIGELLIDLPLPPDTPKKERCGACRRCLDACPTGALIAPYLLNVEKCIAYQTIENHRDIPQDLLPKMGNCLFGCDSCLDACPWNRKVTEHTHRELDPLPELFSLEWNSLTRGQFNRIFRYSPLRRAGWQKIRTRLSGIVNNE
ncbi:MAG: tRNA epoxyqueuosine(34) reductase QueG [Prevotellaceae bacterium]|jgi:epoxyqueuosine reductase|nr:tRNA epoxyqueuosine(34) reductase QueG [Prevotellaceae bacterium]